MTTKSIDPLACFAASPEEVEGVMVDVEHPQTGKVLMRWRLARFGGLNNPAIIRIERQLKARMTQGQRRAIDAGAGDPDIVSRMNRQLFVRVSCLGWELLDPELEKRYGEFTLEKADEVLEAYPRMYDLLSEAAVDEQNFSKDAIAEAAKN